MCEDLAERLADIERRLSKFSSENLSCLESTKLSYIQALLDRANTYLVQGSTQLSSILIEKADSAFNVLALSLNIERENTPARFDEIEDSDGHIIHPAQHFTLLSQEINKSRFTLSGNQASGNKLNEVSNSQSEPELQSFKHYQDMFEKMALDRLLAKVMNQIPENAGPLNPERLVIRSFKALQDISPEYLSRLISYYESLLSLQTFNNSLK